MEKIIDLHIHTTMSDGVLTPKEVIDEALKNDVSTIAIADHDTMDAYTSEIIDYAKNNNINLIPAVEISTKTKRCGIHVLGYNINLKDENFKNELNKLRNARHDYLYDVAKKLEDLGYKINIAALDEIEAVTKAHIALDVVSNEENKELLLKEFGHIPNKGEFIETIMNEGCKACAIKRTITPKEAVKLIQSAGGKAVLAHPVAYKYEDKLTEEEVRELVIDMDVDAIEANYVYVDRNNNVIDECDIWNKFAQENNLISTVGSDFHNDDNIRPLIGLINTNLKLSSEEIDKIINYLLN